MGLQTPHTTIHGACHCGNLSFDFETTCTPETLVIRECQCSFCRYHGGATARDPDGSARIYAKDPGAINLYRFGTRSTDFVLCSVCGIYLGAVITHEGKKYVTLNMRLTSLDLSRTEPIVYDDEPVEARVSRRVELFTPVTKCPF